MRRLRSRDATRPPSFSRAWSSTRSSPPSVAAISGPGAGAIESMRVTLHESHVAWASFDGPVDNARGSQDARLLRVERSSNVESRSSSSSQAVSIRSPAATGTTGASWPASPLEAGRLPCESWTTAFRSPHRMHAPMPRACSRRFPMAPPCSSTASRWALCRRRPNAKPRACGSWLWFTIRWPLETGIDAAVAAALEASERRALAAVRRVGRDESRHRRRAGPLRRRSTSSRRRRAGHRPGAAGAWLAHGPLQLLCVAALVPRKGHDVLFHALASIPSRHWRLTCVGSLERHPAMADQLRALACAKGLDSLVEFAGEADAATLPGYYASADVFVLPTLYEGYGMAVAEALARGLPVVSTATGAIAELVGDEAGIVVPPGDVAALSLALSQVLDDAAAAGVRERLARGARRVRERLPTWDDAASRMDALLHRVAG